MLERPAFAEYLEYLQYWRRPEYARFIRCVPPPPLHPPPTLERLPFPHWAESAVLPQAITARGLTLDERLPASRSA